MTDSIVTQTVPFVNTEQPIKVKRNGRLYWLSVTRACGHCEYLPADAGDDPTGYADAARTDTLCQTCQCPQPAPSSRPRPGRPAGPASAPDHLRLNANQQLQDAMFWLELTQDLLDAIAHGEVRACQYTINYAALMQVKARHTIRKLGGRA